MKDADMLTNVKKTEGCCLAEKYLSIACRNSYVLNRTIQEFGETTIVDYLEFPNVGIKNALQPRDNLNNAIYNSTIPLIGKTLAKQLVLEFNEKPIALTANHHGVDYFSQSVQGSLLFSMSQPSDSEKRKTALILSCGNIPLDNLTYPLGLLLYQINQNSLNLIPQKLPVFPNRHRRSIVSLSVPYDDTMVQSTLRRLDKLVEENIISPHLQLALHDIFNQDYRDPAVLSLRDYSRQSTVLNHRLWKRLFAEPEKAPVIIYLELEKIVGTLLEEDLSTCDSLASCLMFDSELRESVFEELDGQRACWDLEKLTLRMGMNENKKKQNNELSGCGTLLFWGINEARRKIPLFIRSNGSNREVLCGVDDKGKSWEMPYTPAYIKKGLKEKRLLPSLFTCFLTLSLARGVVCAGGYYQAEYLPAIQQGVVNALKKNSKYRGIAPMVAKISTNVYLSGMQTVMVKLCEDLLIPAGPAEIIAAGGLTRSDIDKIKTMTVREAHIASLFDTIPDIAFQECISPDWKRQLAGNCFKLLSDKVVIK